MLFGNATPAAIIQTKPGKVVSGIRKHSFGKTQLNQLNVPIPVRMRPKITIHFGKSFMNAAGMHTPAMKTAIGMENRFRQAGTADNTAPAKPRCSVPQPETTSPTRPPPTLQC